MVMDLERKRRIFSILQQLVELPESEHETLINAECAGDAALAQEIRRRLAVDNVQMLDRSASDIATRLAAAEETLPPGSQLGTWRLVRELGRGGMGTVYLVERCGDGYVQYGALKLIRRGMDSQEVLARFRRERQILSRLDQPHIARLLDGGIADDGRPFLVMEWIDGESIMDWCERIQPDLRTRAELFLQICSAVAYAHRQLIVHRDIKPSNVLIDTHGHPKLLDFGIAKVLEESANDERTAMAVRFLSPAYAAPEQRTTDGVVSTATDIYQLGLLFFELLSGKRYSELKDTTSRRPALLLASGREQAASSGPRYISAQQLRGDPGIIAARALDADPARRYATVEALADDVRRWLDARPILARPDSSSYRLARFVSRHCIATALAAVALIAIIVGATLALLQAQRAERETRLARSAQAFLSSVFEQSSPDTAAGARITARELLDRGAERIRHELSDQPGLRGEMLLTLGVLYRQLGQFEQANGLLEEAYTAAQAADDEGAKVRAALELGVVARMSERFEIANRRFAEVLTADIPDEVRSRVYVERAQTREREGNFSLALADAKLAAQIDLQRGAAGRSDHARDRQIEGLVLTRMGRFEEADAAFEEAIATASAIYGAGDTRVAQIQNDYAVLLLSKSRPVEAEPVTRRALDARRERLGEQHPSVAESLQLLGASLRQQGRLDEAKIALEESLSIQRAVLGNQHGDVANTLNSLSILASSQQRYADAEAYLREALDIERAINKTDTALIATMTTNLAVALMRMGRYDESGELLRKALTIHHSVLGTQHPAVLSNENALAQLEIRRGNAASAVTHARNALSIAEEVLGASRESAFVRSTLANALLRKGEAALALQEARAAKATLDAVDAQSDPRAIQISLFEAEASLALKQPLDALPLAEHVLSELSDRTSPDHAGTLAAHALLSRIHRALGHPDRSQAHRESARQILGKISNPEPALLQELDRD
jgi:tetratricopeptide (TPR) repeat protein/tRNA A-37 threonylcarbamoyl transferase component Bud32